MSGFPTDLAGDNQLNPGSLRVFVGKLAPHEWVISADRAVWITYSFWSSNSGSLASRFDCLLLQRSRNYRLWGELYYWT